MWAPYKQIVAFNRGDGLWAGDGTSHVLSKDEAKFVFEKGCEHIIVGSGQEGNVQLSPEAEAYFAKKGCKVLLQPTSEAIRAFNRSHAKKIGLFHVTC